MMAKSLSGANDNEETRRELAGKSMEKSAKFMYSARLLLGGGLPDQAVDRVYYSLFFVAKAALFLPETAPPEALETLVSLDPNRLAPINVFTYQLLSTPGESQAWVEMQARERWVQELLEEGQTASLEAAWKRLTLLQNNNPPAYHRELARRYQRLKRQLLQGEPTAVAPDGLDDGRADRRARPADARQNIH